MNRPFNKRTRRLLRLFKPLPGRMFHEEYFLDQRLREDLAQEAAFGAEHFDDAILTPELFVHLRGSTRKVMRPTVNRANSKGTVIIVPGGLATELADKGDVRPGRIWLDPPALASGRFTDLQLAKYRGPNKEYDLHWPDVKIKALEAFPILYHPLFVELSNDGWTPEMFPYDWRKDMESGEVSGALKKKIESIATSTNPVHIFTHSQGALVARLAMQQLDKAGNDSLVGKVILAGPANFGAFVAALGVADAVQEIPVCKMLTHPSLENQRVMASFTALYQLMPWDPGLATSLTKPRCDIRQRGFWKDQGLGQIDYDRHELAFPTGGPPWGQKLNTDTYKKRITVIVGQNPFTKTAGGVHFEDGQLKVNRSGKLDGDGWVPDKLAILPNSPAYRASLTGHIGLPRAPKVIDAVLNILNDLPPGLPNA
jgi:hypothetical protein